ncbi:MAG: hypothetical protein P8074_24465 [Anaerolineales bacterium]
MQPRLMVVLPVAEKGQTSFILALAKNMDYNKNSGRKYDNKKQFQSEK